MQLFLSGETFRYECENLCRLFFPYSPVKVEEPGAPLVEGPRAFASIEKEDGPYHYRVEVTDGEKTLVREDFSPDLQEYTMTNLLYRSFVELTGTTPAWGMLTGIHPVKLLRQYVEERGEEAGTAYFQEHCHVSAPKADLALRVLRAQTPAVEALGENDCSLYVSIPFCPTRCAYCSFVSQDVEHAKKLVDPYFSLLLVELEKTAQVIQGLGLSLISVYIGGGTPTTLSAGQLSALCGKIRQEFDLSRCGEFTVEAGRPDSITRDKLQVLLDHGITRISINPQTMNQATLDLIGRRHTVEQTVSAFCLAREMGFDNINMDLIVGLPGEGKEQVEHTMKEIGKLDPDSVTVHSLALKRAARLSLFKDEYQDISFQNSSEIMDMTASYCERAGLYPYYLYRQKNMAGNFENVGYAREGKAGIYNILIMEEVQSILALGAGGSTKVVYGPDRIERIENVKDIKNYIERIDEMIERKKRIG
mgnify:CR=1 FL=1